MAKRLTYRVMVAGVVVTVAVGLMVTGTSQASVATALALPAKAAELAPAHPELDYMGSTLPASERATVGRPRAQAMTVQAIAAAPTGTPGLDVSHYQNQVDWNSVAADGAKFAYVKATEGTTYLDPQFTANYTGSANVGLKRSAYHFGLPDQASGVDQAMFFVAHGGGWSGLTQGRSLAIRTSSLALLASWLRSPPGRPRPNSTNTRRGNGGFRNC